MWQALIPAVVSVIDKVLPDPQQAAEAKLRALELGQRGDLAQLDAEVRLALGQMEINKAEVQTDLFRGGWRPATGWCCVAGLAYQFIAQPLLPWLVALMVWAPLTRGWGMDRTLSGPADIALQLCAYVLPLAVLELYLRAQDGVSARAKHAVAGLLALATILTALGVVGAVVILWGPYML